MVKYLKLIFGKGHGGQFVPNDDVGHVPIWKKKSIFWELPCREVLEVRSSIDMMYMTKNLCVNLLAFLWHVWEDKRYTEKHARTSNA
jgi:hypothetical protein